MVKKDSIIINSNEVKFIITDFKNEVKCYLFGSQFQIFLLKKKVLLLKDISKIEVFLLLLKFLAKHDENYMPPEVKEALGEK